MLRDPPTKHTRTQTGKAEVGVNVVAHASDNVGQERNQADEHEATGNPVLLKQLEEIIQLLKQHHNHVRGIMLYCDEFQNLSDDTRDSAQLFQTARQHLETLDEGFHDEPNRKLPIITILAGIPPAEETLTSFLTRRSSESIIELLPVDGYPITDPSSTYCTEIIQDYIEHGQKIDGHHLTVDAPTLHQWGQNCGGHVVHATHAGTIIQQQFHDWHQEGKTRIEDTEIDIIAEQLKIRRIEYYQERLTAPNLIKATTEEREAAEILLAHIIVTLHEQQQQDVDTERPTFCTWEAIEYIAQQLVPGKPKLEKALSILIHIGALRRMEPSNRIARHRYQTEPLDLPYVDAPIPTMSEYILTRKTKAIIQEISTNNQAMMQGYKGFTITQWCWNKTPRRIEITRSHHFEYHPGREPHEFTAAEAEQVLRRVQNALANDWLPSMSPRARTGETRPGWMDIIHAAAPPRKTPLPLVTDTKV